MIYFICLKFKAVQIACCVVVVVVFFVVFVVAPGLSFLSFSLSIALSRADQ